MPNMERPFTSLFECIQNWLLFANSLAGYEHKLGLGPMISDRRDQVHGIDLPTYI